MKALLDAALGSRAALLERLHAEGTDAYRLFHGTVEGRPGLTVDRYGPLLIAQEFFDPLTADEIEAIRGLALALGLEPVVNRRGDPGPPTEPRVCHEQGQSFQVVGRHRGLDPWLFLDFRAGRRWLRAHAAGDVLNLFAYTCTAGVAAANARVLNVDFGRWCLDVGRENAALNGVAMEFLREDAFPVLRQFAGLEVKGRASRRSFTRLEPRRFDLIVLDPPTVANSPFGKVDLVHDYPALLKPCLLALRPGGRVLATNHAAEVDLDAWLAVVRRTGEKAGRPVTVLEVLSPEEDFPSPDASPPLKMAVLQSA